MTLKSYSEVIMGTTGLLGALYLSLLMSNSPIETSNGLTSFIIVTSLIVAGLAEWLARGLNGMAKANAYLVMVIGLVLFVYTLVTIQYSYGVKEIPIDVELNDMTNTIVMGSAALNITFFIMAARLFLKEKKAG